MMIFSLHIHNDSLNYQIWKPKRIRGHLWSVSIHSSTKNPMLFPSCICLPHILHDPTSCLMIEVTKSVVHQCKFAGWEFVG